MFPDPTAEGEALRVSLPLGMLTILRHPRSQSPAPVLDLLCVKLELDARGRATADQK